MRKRSPWKGIVITVLVLAVLCGGGFFAFRQFGSRNAQPVYVYDFSMLGMTEYWGDSKESYGPVRSDKIQTVYLSGTQTVTEVLVAPGDTVKKGDVLLTFDTTLTDLSLERERLAVEKLKLDLQVAYEYLAEINSMVPMVIPEYSDDPMPEDPGTPLSGDFQVAQLEDSNDGSSADMPLICWLRDGTVLTDSLYEQLRQASSELQAKRKAKQEPPAPPADPTDPTTEPVETEPEEIPQVHSFYCVFKVTEGNTSLANTKIWQGMYVALNESDSAFYVSFFDASGVLDNSKEDPVLPSRPEINYGSGFTASQIAQMRAEQEKTIKDLEFSVKMEEANYKIMQTEISDGNIYAQLDGQVVSVLDEEEAMLTNQPIIKVSGGGGFYIECSVSELDRDSLAIGQEVTVNDWRTGSMYIGTILRVDEYPTQDGGFYGNGNPNVSYYPFTVFVDGDADLMEYNYVDVVYGTADSTNGIYLENPYLRKEGGESFVYVCGEDGKLEKRVVTTGKSLWGSYTEILSGLSETDQIAFPYGKNVVPGAPTVHGDWSTLYE